jgi:hypothetical protein
MVAAVLHGCRLGRRRDHRRRDRRRHALRLTESSGQIGAHSAMMHCPARGTPYGHFACMRAPFPAEPMRRVPQHPPDEMPKSGRQSGHHTTPAFTRERARRRPTPALLPWTNSGSTIPIRRASAFAMRASVLRRLAGHFRRPPDGRSWKPRSGSDRLPLLGR